MTVYVDNARHPYRHLGMSSFRLIIMCHMIADTLDELHAMADRIGVHRVWFQDRASFPHYDVCRSKRELAIKFGAKPMERRAFVTEMRRIRATIGENSVSKRL